MRERAHQRRHDLQQTFARGRDAEDVLELTAGDEDARGTDKAGNHRVTEEVSEKAQAHDGHEAEDQAREQGQQHRRTDVCRTAGRKQRAQRGGSHQRNHRHRPHGQRPAGA